MSEQRILNISVSRPGGTAGSGSISYKLSLPTVWLRTIGITPEDKSIIATFDGEQITIVKNKLQDK